MISLVITLALVGFVVWAVTTYVPMPEAFRKAIVVVVVVLLVLYLIQVLGLDVPLPRRP